MSQQNDLLKNVSVGALKEMLGKLQSLSGEDKKKASSEYTKALMEIQNTGADFVPQSMEALRLNEAFRRSNREQNALDQPQLRDNAEFQVALGNKQRQQRAQGALDLIDPLLTRAEDRTARRDEQQERMLGSLIGSREKLADQRNMVNKLDMLKQLGLGAMIMFG